MGPGQALFTDPTGTMRHSISWHEEHENTEGDKRLEDVLGFLSSFLALSSILSDIL